MNSLDTLKAFRIFADTLNFTHAAEQLHISQPALHTKIQELSRSQQAPLYLKEGRQLRLTAQGQRLAAFAREIEARFHEYHQESLPLRVAAGQGAYLYLLGPALQQLQEPVRLLLGDAETVRNGHADIAVGPAVTDSSHLQVHPYREVGQVLLLPKDHALAKKRRLQLEHCAGLPLIVPPADRPQRLLLDQLLPEYRVAAESSNWELTLHFVSLGLGLAIVNDFCPTPKGFVARPLSQLPNVRYQVFLPRGHARSAGQALAEKILKTVTNSSPP